MSRSCWTILADAVNFVPVDKLRTVTAAVVVPLCKALVSVDDIELQAALEKCLPRLMHPLARRLKSGEQKKLAMQCLVGLVHSHEVVRRCSTTMLQSLVENVHPAPFSVVLSELRTVLLEHAATSLATAGLLKAAAQTLSVAINLSQNDDESFVIAELNSLYTEKSLNLLRQFSQVAWDGLIDPSTSSPVQMSSSMYLRMFVQVLCLRLEKPEIMEEGYQVLERLVSQILGSDGNSAQSRPVAVRVDALNSFAACFPTLPTCPPYWKALCPWLQATVLDEDAEPAIRQGILRLLVNIPRVVYLEHAESGQFAQLLVQSQLSSSPQICLSQCLCLSQRLSHADFLPWLETVTDSVEASMKWMADAKFCLLLYARDQRYWKLRADAIRGMLMARPVFQNSSVGENWIFDCMWDCLLTEDDKRVTAVIAECVDTLREPGLLERCLQKCINFLCDGLSCRNEVAENLVQFFRALALSLLLGASSSVGKSFVDSDRWQVPLRQWWKTQQQQQQQQQQQSSAADGTCALSDEQLQTLCHRLLFFLDSSSALSLTLVTDALQAISNLLLCRNTCRERTTTKAVTAWNRISQRAILTSLCILYQCFGVSLPPQPETLFVSFLLAPTTGVLDGSHYSEPMAQRLLLMQSIAEKGRRVGDESITGASSGADKFAMLRFAALACVAASLRAASPCGETLNIAIALIPSIQQIIENDSHGCSLILSAMAVLMGLMMASIAEAPKVMLPVSLWHGYMASDNVKSTQQPTMQVTSWTTIWHGIAPMLTHLSHSYIQCHSAGEFSAVCSCLSGWICLGAPVESSVATSMQKWLGKQMQAPERCWYPSASLTDLCVFEWLMGVSRQDLRLTELLTTASASRLHLSDCTHCISLLCLQELRTRDLGPEMSGEMGALVHFLTERGTFEGCLE